MNAIVTERKRRSMTQKRLAHEAGIDARTLRKIEKGEQVSPDSYRAACLALGIEPHRPEPTAPQRLALSFREILHLSLIALVVVAAAFAFHRVRSAAPNYEITMLGEADCMTALGLPQSRPLDGWAAATSGLVVTDVKTFPGKARCATVMRVKSDLIELALIDSLAQDGIEADVDVVVGFLPSKFVASP